MTLFNHDIELFWYLYPKGWQFGIDRGRYCTWIDLGPVSVYIGRAW